MCDMSIIISIKREFEQNTLRVLTICIVSIRIHCNGVVGIFFRTGGVANFIKLVQGEQEK